MANKIKNYELYTRLQSIYVAELDIKVGDELRVAMSGDTDDTNLCENSIPECLYDELVTIISIQPQGFEVIYEDDQYILPFYCVEPTGAVGKVIVPDFLADYSTSIGTDGIEVGCQTVSFRDFDRLAEMVATFRRDKNL